MENKWEILAKEYKTELKEVLCDISKALFYLNQNMPKSFKKAINLLERSNNIANENLKILSLHEIETEIKKVEKVKKIEKAKEVEKEKISNLLDW